MESDEDDDIDMEPELEFPKTKIRKIDVKWLTSESAAEYTYAKVFQKWNLYCKEIWEGDKKIIYTWDPKWKLYKQGTARYNSAITETMLSVLDRAEIHKQIKPKTIKELRRTWYSKRLHANY